MGIVPRHQVWVEEGVPEFVESFVYRSPGFADIHEEVFPDRSDAVEARGFGDLALQKGLFAPAAWACPGVVWLCAVPELVLRRFPGLLKIIPF